MPNIMPKPDVAPHHDAYTSWQHIRRLSWPIMLSIFGVLAFALDGFAHAAKALVGGAIGQKSKSMLTFVIRSTNYLASMVAGLQGALLWLGKPLILSLMTS